MKRSLFATLIIVFCIGNLFAKINPKNLVSTSVYSTVLKEKRELKILLPSEFQNTYFSYPVIYLLDAESNFGTGVEVLSFLMDNHFIPPHVVVGVPNTDRFRDMTPVDSVLNKTIFPTRGGADTFLKALETDIFPFISKQYRGNSRRLVLGHNYSGLFVMHAFISRPELFDRFMAFSPILWWNDTAMVNDMDQFLTENSSIRKHLFVSFAKEAKNMLEACKDITKLMEQKAPGDLKWKYEWMPDEDHYSLYRKSLMRGMEIIFKDYKYPSVEDLAAGGIKSANSYLRDIMLNYGRKEKLPYSLLESVCLQLKQNEKYDEAIKFLTYTSVNYPDKAEPYFYAGEIYEITEKPKQAVKFYEVAHNKDKGRWDYEQKFLAMQKLLEELKNKEQNQAHL
ncbi:MAG: alpha/beta hydrolase-fold protein [Marinifilaceae bacterium]|jgi:predicted alpha/beta superfamily hydrolase|nr:alpha/beta hydrolase-fold protein [Marinifilaceae bacterium]